MPKEKYSAKRVIGYLFGLYKIAPAKTAVLLTSQAVSTILTTTLAPIFVSKLLTSIADGTATLSGCLNLLIIYSVLKIVGNVVIFRISIWMAYMAETKMQKTTLLKVLRHLTDKSLAYHSNKMSGGTISNVTKLSGSIERFWDTIAFTLVPMIVTLVSVCIVLGFTIWQYALAISILSIIIIIVVIRAQNSLAPLSNEVATKSSAMTAYLSDVISNIGAVKAFAKEKTELKEYEKRINKWQKASMKEMKGVLVVTGTFSLMMSTLNIGAFLAAIFATQYHLANIGVVYLMLSYTISVVSELWSVSGMTRSYIRIIGDAGPMIETVYEDIEIEDPKRPEKLGMKNGLIEFDNIHFQHDNSKKALFDNFYLEIKPGERIGLVGKSGSGKTSLTRLLLRFNDLQGGEIKIDGQNIAKVAQSDLRSRIAYVPQEPVLFHRSLRENVIYGKQNATEKDIKKAIKQANAQDFIDCLPDGMDTMVGERGVKLSGGQRQRIAIARAILKDAPILVLDEATSALDSESEHLIQEALSKLMNNRTSIVVAHRLSTIAEMDRIVVLDKGKIIEQGTHQQLIKNGGTYAKLWKRQSGGFIKE